MNIYIYVCVCVCVCVCIHTHMYNDLAKNTNIISWILIFFIKYPLKPSSTFYHSSNDHSRKETLLSQKAV